MSWQRELENWYGEGGPPRRLSRLLGDMPRLAWLGASAWGREPFARCVASGLEIAGVYDDAVLKQGQCWCGKVIQPSTGLSVLPKNVPVILASHRLLPAYTRLVEMGFSTVLPLGLLVMALPSLFGEHPFYTGILDELTRFTNNYLALSDRLADARSRSVLDAILRFRVTLDPFPLAPVVEDQLYFPSDIITLGDQETYIDCGAFDGDSIDAFLGTAKGAYKSLIAFEPDNLSYDRLCTRWGHLPRARFYNHGLHSSVGSMQFLQDGDRHSMLAQAGMDRVSVTTLDETLGPEGATFIKMNIEGAEYDALLGARTTIAHTRPRLAISIYHRPSDLRTLPALISELHPGYRLYLRQHDGGIIESVLYAISS